MEQFTTVRQPRLEGNGKPDCPKCHGRGCTDAPFEKGRVPSVSTCDCVLIRQANNFAHAQWPALKEAAVERNSKLADLCESRVWLTAPAGVLEAHARKALLVQLVLNPDKWSFRRVTDTDLLDAYLPNRDVRDAEVDDQRKQHDGNSAAYNLRELVLSPDLLIIHTGYKQTRNSATSDVLAEALRYRDGKATWLVDSPDLPFAEGMACFSKIALRDLQNFKRVYLDGSPASLASSTPAPPLLVQTQAVKKRLGDLL